MIYTPLPLGKSCERHKFTILFIYQGKKGKSDGKPAAAGGKGKGGGKGGKKKGNKNETEALNGTVHLTTQV